MRALVTGASGYVGKHICSRLLINGWQVRSLMRSEYSGDKPIDGLETFVAGDLTTFSGWEDALDECDVVIHCAGLAHIPSTSPAYDPSSYQAINTDVVLALAKAARSMRTPKVIFVSSVAAYGNLPEGVVATESLRCTPDDPYGLSKLRAEEGLAEILRGSSVQYLILRPPMIYGRDCPGNFAKLAKIIKTGLPLPMGSLVCDRTLLDIENLVDFVAHICSHPDDQSGVFNIADEETLTLQELMIAISGGLGRSINIVPFPVSVLRCAAAIVGRKEMIEKLSQSLILDCAKARQTFQWRQPRAALDGVAEAASSFA